MDEQKDYVIITMKDGVIYRVKYFYTYIAGEFHACSETIARLVDMDDYILDIKFIDIEKIEYCVNNMRDYIERVQTVCNESNDVETDEQVDTDFESTLYDMNKTTVTDTSMFG